MARGLSRIATDFHDAYEKQHSCRLAAPVEMVGLHVVTFAEVGKLGVQPKPPTHAPASEAPRDVAGSTTRYRAFTRPTSTTAGG